MPPPSFAFPPGENAVNRGSDRAIALRSPTVGGKDLRITNSGSVDVLGMDVMRPTARDGQRVTCPCGAELR